jgi:hypothetical protein
MPRQVPDEEYAFLQGRRQIADFVESIYQDPTLTKEAQALIKKKYPNLAIPDYDLETKVTQRLDAEKKEREDREAEQRKTQEQERFHSVRGETQKKYGFTDKAMEELEQMMVERNIGDYEVAATYKASKEPRPSDVTFNDGRWNHDKAPGFKEIAADPEGWAHGEILKSLYADEERRKQQRF